MQVNSFPPTSTTIKGDNMNPIIKILILLSMLCVIGSTAAVHAGDLGNYNDYNGPHYENTNGAISIQHAPNNEGGNAPNITAGNPILSLLTLGVVLGSSALIKRNKI